MNCTNCNKPLHPENGDHYASDGANYFCDMNCLNQHLRDTVPDVNPRAIPGRHYAEHLCAHLEVHNKMVGRMRNGKKGEYTCMQDFVLRNGYGFKVGRCHQRYKRYAAPQHCYHNALLIAKRHNLVYVEGYAMGIIPTNHAWCVDPKKHEVIDPTWGEDNQHEYVGVPIKTSYVEATLEKAGQYSVIDNWTMGWPIMTDPVELWRHDYRPPEERPGSVQDLPAEPRLQGAPQAG